MTCRRVKEFLSQKGIVYQERDVSVDEEALMEMAQLGVYSTPVTLIGDEQVIGFDRARLESLLFEFNQSVSST